MADDEQTHGPVQRSHEGPGIFGEPLRESAIATFGSDGAWLLLSIVHYGWRAFYDLAIATVTGTRALVDERSFLDTYSSYANIKDLVGEAQSLSRPDLGAMAARAQHYR